MLDNSSQSLELLPHTTVRSLLASSAVSRTPGTGTWDLALLPLVVSPASLGLIMCLGSFPFSILFFILSYLGSYGCTANETPASALLISVLSIILDNMLVSKEVRVCYCGHTLQQASYQWSSVLVTVGILPQKHAFLNTVYWSQGTVS